MYIQNSTNFDIGLDRDFIPKTLKARSRTILALTSLVSSQKQKPTIVKTVEPQQFLKAVIRGGIGELFCVARRHSLIFFSLKSLFLRQGGKILNNPITNNSLN